MNDLDARLLAKGLGIRGRSRPKYLIGSRLVFALGILVGFILARIMTLITP